MTLAVVAPSIGKTDGSCWTCVTENLPCNGDLPVCKTCVVRGATCLGYGVRLSWPDNFQMGNSTSIPKTTTPAQSESLSQFGLPSEDNFFMQHFMRNIARIALAVDHEGNGYRSLLPMALSEPAILNAALAVAASHYSRWQQKTTGDSSRKYLREAHVALNQRFQEPSLIYQQETLTCMLLLVSYDVFSGSLGWKGHLNAIRSWVRSRGDCTDLSPFLKNWICLVDTQNALNAGTFTMPELDEWMDVTAAAGQSETLDSLFGCSVRLPRLMSKASWICASQRSYTYTREQIQEQVVFLQDQIRSTAMAPEAKLSIGLSCDDTAKGFSTTLGMSHEDLRQRAVATAEIFRHSCHIYVHRILSTPDEPLPPQIRESLEEAMSLLPSVPDALGPGANLGWCLVVLGSELDDVEERDYITSRWSGLQSLGLCNSDAGKMVLDEVWSHRDMVQRGEAFPEQWQDTMQRIGQSQILV